MVTLSEWSDADIARLIADENLGGLSRRVDYVRLGHSSKLMQHGSDVAIVALEGQASVEIDGQAHVLSAGRVISVPAASSYRALVDGEAQLLVVSRGRQRPIQTSSGTHVASTAR
jgi:hypothetical protein